MTISDYLITRCGMESSLALFNFGLTMDHARAVWHGKECLSASEMRLIHQVFCVPVGDLRWFNRQVPREHQPKER